MSNISTLDKISSAIKYAYNHITYKGPYIKVIFDNKIEDYKKNSEIMNSIHNNDKIQNDAFSTEQRVLVSYLGTKNFNTVVMASSYTEINKKIIHIIENAQSYPKKKFGDFTKFIDKIYLLTNYNTEIDVTNTLNIIIQHKEEIKISDLPLLHKEKSKNIKSIKILHYNDMVLKEIVLDFNNNMNKSVDSLNEWIE
jgi:hypothetical protein